MAISQALLFAYDARMISRQFVKQPPLSLLFLIVAMLLSAQASSLEHAVDHTHHDSQELCQSFIAFDHSPSLVNNTDQLLFNPARFTHSPVIFIGHTEADTRFYTIRAPPALNS